MGKALLKKKTSVVSPFVSKRKIPFPLNLYSSFFIKLIKINSTINSTNISKPFLTQLSDIFEFKRSQAFRNLITKECQRSLNIMQKDIIENINN